MNESIKIMEFLRLGQDPAPDCQIDEATRTVKYICTDPLGNQLIWSTPFIEYNRQASVERLWRLCIVAYKEELDNELKLAEMCERFNWPSSFRTGTLLFRQSGTWKVQYGGFSSTIIPEWIDMALPDILPDHYTLRKREDGGTEILKNVPRV